MVIAQWVVNVLQFLTLLAVLWYTWETHQAGVLTRTQLEREWKPQCHFSIGDLDPTHGIGEMRFDVESGGHFRINVVNLGRPAILVRGLLLGLPNDGKTSQSCTLVAVASGEMKTFTVEPDSILTLLRAYEPAGVRVHSNGLDWKGKIEIALWFEAIGENYSSKSQYLEVEFKENKMVGLRQMTETEFKYLTRESSNLEKKD
jgi:hypothetical protein